MAPVRTKMAPPWITYVNQLNALFEHDSGISIEYNDTDKEVKLYVDNAEKAAALFTILPEEKKFGNISLFITVIPANRFAQLDEDVPNKEVFDYAFAGNPIYAFSKQIDNPWSFNCTYVVFKNKVVQFFNDNLNDIYGNTSTLYQDIAAEVFEDQPGIFYCTDIEGKVGKPLGEWP